MAAQERVREASPARRVVLVRVFFGLTLTLGFGAVLFIDAATGSDVATTAAAAAVVCLGLHEFYRMAENRRLAPLRRAGMAAGAALVAVQWLEGLALGRGAELRAPLVETGLFAALSLLCLWTLLRRRDERAPADLAVTAAGLLYVWFPVSFLLRMRGLPGLSAPAAVWAVLHFLAAAKTGDVAAFFTGRFLGRRKLAPSLSPGKTVEGSLGGLAASVGVSTVLCLAVPSLGRLLHPAEAALYGLVVGLLAQAGDLFESFLKRWAGVKNSGDIIPEFGGMLDLMDSVVFAAPPACFLLLLLG